MQPSRDPRKRTGKDWTWQQIPQVAMVTEMEWCAKEVKFLIPKLAFGLNVVPMDSLWMANRTELHSKA